jgi:phage protein D
LLHPTYSVTLGDHTLDPEESTELISLRVDSSMGRRAGSLDCTLRLGEAGMAVTKGDSATVSLGYDDKLSQVFQGIVDTVDPGAHSVHVLALNSISKLQQKRADKFYEKQNCGAIVKDLAGDVSVTVDKVQNGIQLPYYAVDSNRSYHEHVLELAERCGFEVYATNEDKLCFRKYESSSPKSFEFGKNILSISSFDQKPMYDSVHVYGESPSSSMGTETAHWLTKQSVDASAGEGNEFLLQDRVVRTTAAAASVAEAALNKIVKSVVILLEVVGEASVKLNGTASINKMPDLSLNGQYQVRGVEHTLSKSKGFTTTLRLSGYPVA